LIKPRAPGQQGAGPRGGGVVADANLADQQGPHLVEPGQGAVDRVDRVVGAAAGMGVRPGVVPGFPDRQGDSQVLDVVAERG
jgi:hypothetical protein